eukprot:gene15563-biopygen674
MCKTISYGGYSAKTNVRDHYLVSCISTPPPLAPHPPTHSQVRGEGGDGGWHQQLAPGMSIDRAPEMSIYRAPGMSIYRAPGVTRAEGLGREAQDGPDRSPRLSFGSASRKEERL